MGGGDRGDGPWGGRAVGGTGRGDGDGPWGTGRGTAGRGDRA
jgi:hypothetical protein